MYSSSTGGTIADVLRINDGVKIIRDWENVGTSSREYAIAVGEHAYVATTLKIMVDSWHGKPQLGSWPKTWKMGPSWIYMLMMGLMTMKPE